MFDKAVSRFKARCMNESFTEMLFSQRYCFQDNNDTVGWETCEVTVVVS